jgi:hypothetical protein
VKIFNGLREYIVKNRVREVPLNAVDAITGVPIVESDVLVTFGDLYAKNIYIKAESYFQCQAFGFPPKVSYIDFTCNDKKYIHPFEYARFAASEFKTYVPKLVHRDILPKQETLSSVMRIPIDHLFRCQDLLLRSFREILEDAYKDRTYERFTLDLPVQNIVKLHFVDFPSDTDTTVCNSSYKTELDFGRLYTLEQFNELRGIHPITRKPIDYRYAYRFVTQFEVTFQRLHNLFVLSGFESPTTGQPYSFDELLQFSLEAQKE